MSAAGSINMALKQLEACLRADGRESGARHGDRAYGARVLPQGRGEGSVLPLEMDRMRVTIETLNGDGVPQNRPWADDSCRITGANGSSLWPLQQHHDRSRPCWSFAARS